MVALTDLFREDRTTESVKHIRRTQSAFLTEHADHKGSQLTDWVIVNNENLPLGEPRGAEGRISITVRRLLRSLGKRL